MTFSLQHTQTQTFTNIIYSQTPTLTRGDCILVPPEKPVTVTELLPEAAPVPGLQAVTIGESKDTAPETPPACRPEDTIRVRPWEIPLPARPTTQEVERHWLALPVDEESRKAAQLSYNPSL